MKTNRWAPVPLCRSHIFCAKILPSPHYIVNCHLIYANKPRLFNLTKAWTQYSMHSLWKPQLTSNNSQGSYTGLRVALVFLEDEPRSIVELQQPAHLVLELCVVLSIAKVRQPLPKHTGSLSHQKAAGIEGVHMHIHGWSRTQRRHQCLHGIPSNVSRVVLRWQSYLTKAGWIRPMWPSFRTAFAKFICF